MGSQKIRGEPLREILVGVLCLVPLLYLAWFVSRFFLDVVYSDQWGLVMLIEKHQIGQLSFSDLWHQQNVHRTFFPKLIILPLARATHWNHAYEVAVSLACGLTTYLVIVGQLARIYRGTHQRSILWLNCFLLSCLVFSLAQYPNWLWGMQIQLWLCVTAAVAGLCILSDHLTTRRVIAALALGFVATHSFANGLVYWAVGLLLVWLAPAPSPSQRRSLLVIWLLFGALAVFSFFYDFTTHGRDVSDMVAAPAERIAYLLAFLGNPIAHGSLRLAQAAGVLSLVLLAGLCVHLGRNVGVPLRTLLPLLGLGLFAIGSAALTAAGRSGLPVSQALEPRYVTTAQLIWVADITLICLTFGAWRKSHPSNAPGNPPSSALAGAAAGALLVLLMVGVAVGHVQGMQDARKYSKELRRVGRTVAGKYPDLAPLDVRPLGPRTGAALRWRLPVLYDYKLSLFRERLPSGRDSE